MSCTSLCIKRLQGELREIMNNPVDNITIVPTDNILMWMYIINGAKGTAFEGGEYVGKITFPFEYPTKPPTIMLITPNGVFHTNMQICLSVSSLHPESWVPSWKAVNIINGVASLMVDILNTKFHTTGSISKSSPEHIAKLASESHEFNVKHNLLKVFT